MSLVGGQASSADPGELLEQPETKEQKKRRRGIYIAGFIWIAVALAFVWGAAYFGLGSLVKQPIPAITGVSLFAVFYLMAQFDERVVELLSNLPGFGESQKDKVAKGKTLTKPEQELQHARTVAIWCFASTIGIVLCYLTIGLFQMVSVVFTEGGHSVDAILSGVIVGSGTKPLHDLVGYIETKNK